MRPEKNKHTVDLWNFVLIRVRNNNFPSDVAAVELNFKCHATWYTAGRSLLNWAPSKTTELPRKFPFCSNSVKNIICTAGYVQQLPVGEASTIILNQKAG